MPDVSRDLLLAVSILLTLIAGLTLVNNRAQRMAWLYFAVCITCGLWNLSAAMLHGVVDEKWANIWRLAGLLSVAVFLPTWLYLFMKLSAVGESIRSLLPGLLALYGVFVLIVCASSRIVTFVPNRQGGSYTYARGVGFFALMGFISLGLLVVCAVLIGWLRRTALRRERVQAAFYLVSMGILLTISLIAMVWSETGIPPLETLGIVMALCVIVLMVPVSGILSLGIHPSAISSQVLSTINLPVLMLGTQNEVVMANKAAERFFQTGIDGRLGQADFSSMVICEREYLFDDTLTVENEIPVRCRNGKRCQISTTRVSDLYGDTVGRIVVVYDMTDQLRMIEDLHIAKEEAVAANEAKSYFLANVSHEIRTPMNAIVGITELVLREKISPQIREHALGIRQASNGLLSIINDILDLSKIERGKMEIYSGMYSTVSMLSDIIGLVNIRLGDKKVGFVVDVDSSLPETLVGDETRVKQVMLNVLNNAVKFTQQGIVHLTILCDEVGQDVVLRVLVRDTGCGIRPEDMDKLFKAFSQLDTRRNSDLEGTGLGLTITKQFVKLMGGTINVESEYGAGSTFVLNIPQKRASATPIAYVENPEKRRVIVYEPEDAYAISYMHSFENLGVNVAVCDNVSRFYDHMLQFKYPFVFVAKRMLPRVEPIIDSLNPTATVVLMLDRREQMPPDAGQKRKYKSFHLPMYCLQIANILNEEDLIERGRERQDNAITFIAPNAEVLIVDDNQVNMKVAAGLMKPYEMRVITASSAHEAIEIVQNHCPDLVFMDHIMPVMDGVDATRAIRELPGERFKTLPIIALSANAVSGTREMFRDAGLNDFLPKPIEVSRLNQLLRRWIPQEKQIASAKRPAEVTEDRLMRLGIKGVNITLGIASLGGDLDGYLDILEVFLTEGRGKLTLLRKMTDEKDVKGIAVEVHALKSACASIGAYESSMKARTLEEACKQGDLEFLFRGIEDFLQDLGHLLEHIRAALATIGNDARKPGSVEYLAMQLNGLLEALDHLNLAAAEALYAHIDGFIWPSGIEESLRQIGAALAMFQYDEAAELTAALKDKTVSVGVRDSAAEERQI